MAINHIVIIGAGRVATQLGKAFVKQNRKVVQVISRTKSSAEKLAAGLGANAETDLNNIDSSAGICIIATTDEAVPLIAQKLKLPKSIVVHTSGSLNMDVLRHSSDNYGVFYPLNTFSKTKDIDLSSTPICIEASNQETGDLLLDLAQAISSDVRLINSQQRAVLHIAAVFACNFTNFMFVNADEILKKAGMQFDLLLPLINETIDKLNALTPAEAQTGPAVRNDKNILLKHIQSLQSDEDKRILYELISGLITRFFSENKNKETL